METCTPVSGVRRRSGSKSSKRTGHETVGMISSCGSGTRCRCESMRPHLPVEGAGGARSNRGGGARHPVRGCSRAGACRCPWSPRASACQPLTSRHAPGSSASHLSARGKNGSSSARQYARRVPAGSSARSAASITTGVCPVTSPIRSKQRYWASHPISSSVAPGVEPEVGRDRASRVADEEGAGHAPDEVHVVVEVVTDVVAQCP